jgi:hypothetical protein
MMTRLGYYPLLLIIALTLTVGTQECARTMLLLSFSRLFAADKNAVAPNRATVQSLHHRRSCFPFGNLG